MTKKETLTIGAQYNLLTPLEKIGSKDQKTTYLCVCACGVKKVLIGTRVKRGKTKSCGCLRSMIGGAHIAYPYIDYVGQKSGRLTVVEREYRQKAQRAHVLCDCECGNRVIAPASKIRSKVLKSCGCLFKEKNNREKKNVMFGRPTA